MKIERCHSCGGACGGGYGGKPCRYVGGTTELERLRADKVRLDWMEANLCRAGEVRDANGNCLKLARTWAIMGELETLRDTVDAAMTANARIEQGRSE